MNKDIDELIKWMNRYFGEPTRFNNDNLNPILSFTLLNLFESKACPWLSPMKSNPLQPRMKTSVIDLVSAGKISQAN